MARPRKDKAPEPSTTAAKPSEVIEVISEKKLKALLNQARSSTKDIASITGEMREKIGYAKEHDHLHTGAFGLTRRLDRMEPEKLADFMDHFDHYFNVSGLAKRREQAQRLNFGPGDAESEEGDEDDGKVRQLRQPQREAAE